MCGIVLFGKNGSGVPFTLNKKETSMFRCVRNTILVMLIFITTSVSITEAAENVTPSAQKQQVWVQRGDGWQIDLLDGMRVGLSIVNKKVTYYAHGECLCSPHSEKIAWRRGDLTATMINCDGRSLISYLPTIIELLIKMKHSPPQEMLEWIEGRMSSVGI